MEQHGCEPPPFTSDKEPANKAQTGILRRVLTYISALWCCRWRTLVLILFQQVTTGCGMMSLSATRQLPNIIWLCEPHGAVVSQQLGGDVVPGPAERVGGPSPFTVTYSVGPRGPYEPHYTTILTCCSKGHSRGADIPLHHAPLGKSIPPKERTRGSPQNRVIICLSLPSPCLCVPDCGFMGDKRTNNIMTSSH